MDIKQFNKQIIDEFRANEGRVAMFADYPMVILHSIGAKSGKVHLVPLVMTLKDEEMLLFASFGGAKTNPAWVFNLRAHPTIDVEYLNEHFTAQIIELSEQETKDKLQIQAAASPVFAKYVDSAAPRVIPVFRILRV